jgi:hypothetical protein
MFAIEHILQLVATVSGNRITPAYTYTASNQAKLTPVLAVW